MGCLVLLLGGELPRGALRSPGLALGDEDRVVTEPALTGARRREAARPNPLDDVLGAFYADVKANNKDARGTLMDGLADLAGAEITKFGTTNLTNK